MACGCENNREIFPSQDLTRWGVQCSSYIEDAANYYTKKQVDDLVESATSSGNCCITEEEVDEKIASAKTEIEAEIPTVPTSNTAFTNDAGYLTQHQSLSGYATEQWVEDKHYITGVDLSDYALKTEIPTVPTSNTAFTNDAGYLTEHQHLKTINNESLVGDGNITITGGSGITSGEVQTMINNATTGLQETLSAGTNIQIQSNVISATDTTYTAGDNIAISNQNVISTVTKFWCGTQGEYDQITTKDPNTVYMIHT